VLSPSHSSSAFASVLVRQEGDDRAKISKYKSPILVAVGVVNKHTKECSHAREPVFQSRSISL